MSTESVKEFTDRIIAENDGLDKEIASLASHPSAMASSEHQCLESGKPLPKHLQKEDNENVASLKAIVPSPTERIQETVTETVQDDTVTDPVEVNQEVYLEDSPQPDIEALDDEEEEYSPIINVSSILKFMMFWIFFAVGYIQFYEYFSYQSTEEVLETQIQPTTRQIQFNTKSLSSENIRSTAICFVTGVLTLVRSRRVFRLLPIKLTLTLAMIAVTACVYNYDSFLAIFRNDDVEQELKPEITFFGQTAKLIGQIFSAIFYAVYLYAYFVCALLIPPFILFVGYLCIEGIPQFDMASYTPAFVYRIGNFVQKAFLVLLTWKNAIAILVTTMTFSATLYMNHGYFIAVLGNLIRPAPKQETSMSRQTINFVQQAITTMISTVMETVMNGTSGKIICSILLEVSVYYVLYVPIMINYKLSKKLTKLSDALSQPFTVVLTLKKAVIIWILAISFSILMYMNYDYCFEIIGQLFDFFGQCWEPEYKPTTLESAVNWFGIGSQVFKAKREPIFVKVWMDWLSTNYPITSKVLAFNSVVLSPLVYILIPIIVAVIIFLVQIIGSLTTAILSTIRNIIGQSSWKSIVLTMTSSLAMVLYINYGHATILGYIPLLLQGSNVVIKLGINLISNIIEVYVSFFMAIILPPLIIMSIADFQAGILLSKVLGIISRNVTKRNAFLVLRVSVFVLCCTISLNANAAAFIFRYTPILVNHVISSTSYVISLYVSLLFAVILPLFVILAQIKLSNKISQ